MVVNDFIPKEIIDAFGWTFVHSIWEGLLLIVLLATLLVGLRRFSSSTKYLICVTFLFLFLASSTVTFYLVYHPVIPKVPIRQVYEERSDVSTIDEDPLIGDKHQDINQAFVPDFEMSLYAQFARFFPTITTIWFLGIILLSIRLLGSWMYLHRLKKQQVRKIGSNWEQRCKQLAKKIRLSKKYILRLSDAVSTPLVIGFLSP